jgi:hypothetical protein
MPNSRQNVVFQPGAVGRRVVVFAFLSRLPLDLKINVVYPLWHILSAPANLKQSQTFSKHIRKLLREQTLVNGGSSMLAEREMLRRSVPLPIAVRSTTKEDAQQFSITISVERRLPELRVRQSYSSVSF